MEVALAEARCAAVLLVLDVSYGISAICGFRIFEDRGRRGCWRQMMRLCSESSTATSFLNMAGDALGAGSLDFFRMQPRGPKEQRLFDAVQRVRELLAAAPPPCASSPVVEAGLLAVELVLDPLASEEARLGLHVWPGSSPDSGVPEDDEALSSGQAAELRKSRRRRHGAIGPVGSRPGRAR